MSHRPEDSLKSPKTWEESAHGRLIDQVMELSPIRIQIYDLDERRFIYQNRELGGDLGYSPAQVAALGPDAVPLLLHPDDLWIREAQLEWSRTAGDGEFLDVEGRLKDVSGEWRWIRDRISIFARDPEGRPRQLLCLAADITANKHTEQELLRLRTMESLTRMAGGIAHNLNNILTTIFCLSELEPGVDASPAEMRDILGRIRRSAEKARLLAAQLLTFASKQVVQPKSVDLHSLLTGAMALVGRSLPPNIELIVQACARDRQVQIDPDQVTQVIVNLTRHAGESMPEGGRLMIRTANAGLPLGPGTNAGAHKIAQRTVAGRLGVLGCREQSHPFADEARRDDFAFATAVSNQFRRSDPTRSFVVLEVSDSGPGMDEPLREHIFEPFLAASGRGIEAGLGLATCHGIVTQAGGHIAVQTEPGRGTTFRVFLPCAADGAEACQPANAAQAETDGNVVLLVEDEPSIRCLAAAALRSAGYAVLEAADGGAALELARRRDESIDLLLTDVLMPVLNGDELARKLKAERPGLRVLHTSGFVGGDAAAALRIDPNAFLAKPYTSVELLARVKQLMAQPITRVSTHI